MRKALLIIYSPSGRVSSTAIFFSLIHSRWKAQMKTCTGSLQDHDGIELMRQKLMKNACPNFYKWSCRYYSCIQQIEINLGWLPDTQKSCLFVSAKSFGQFSDFFSTETTNFTVFYWNFVWQLKEDVYHEE